MRWSVVNDAGGTRANEDHVAIFERGATADILVLDGATALVDEGEDGCNADVVWFVQRFAAELGRLIDAGTPHDVLLDAAALATARAWDERRAGRAVPPHAWPVASLSWLRVTEADGGSASVLLSSLGDCKALVRDAQGTVRDPDPFDNAQEASLYTQVAALRGQGIQGPQDVFARMLPDLRARRTAQNLAPRPVVLSARPQGPFAVRETGFEAPAGSLLLAMSDGFWRLVDPYGLHTADTLMAACAREGLAPLLRTLRDFEAGAGGAASLAVERADDASAVLWRLDERR